MRYLIWPLLILLVIFRYFITRPIYKNGDRVRITATIYSDPIDYETSQYIKVSGLKIYLPLFPQITYGDKIVIEGKVSGNKLESPQLLIVYPSRGPTSILRNKIVGFYQNTLPQPMSGLVAGVTLGSKGALTSEFWNQVKKVGVAHVVVASGTNVTFVTSFLISFLSILLPRRKMIPFAILGIVLYLFISGFDAPLIRAAFMSGSLFLAQETGRLISSSRLLFLTGLVMLVVWPEWLIDIGFILSFVSTATLMLFEKKIREKLSFVPEVLKEGLSTSLAAQVGVAPILFVTFGQFNIWSPVVNALVLWTVPFIMILGAVGGIMGLIFPFLGKIVLYLCYPLVWWFVAVVNRFN